MKRNFLLLVASSGLIVGCASTPMVTLKPSDMITKKENQVINKNMAPLEMAKAGDMNAQFYVGDSYHFGRNGFSEDFGKAYYWYQQASNQGHAKAARRIGWMYDNAEGFERNVEKALYWHKLAFKRGSPDSQTDMLRLKSELYKKNKR